MEYGEAYVGKRVERMSSQPNMGGGCGSDGTSCTLQDGLGNRVEGGFRVIRVSLGKDST